MQQQQYPYQSNQSPQPGQPPIVVVQGGGNPDGKGCGTASIIIAIVLAVVILIPGVLGLLVCGGSCASVGIGCTGCTGCAACASEYGEQSAARNQQIIEANRADCQPPNVYRLRPGGLNTWPEDWECVPSEQFLQEQEASNVNTQPSE